MRSITLFRLGHRIVRDQRITSHVALSARALGCNAFIYSGEKDKNMEQSIMDVASRWGGNFTVSYSEKTKSLIRDFDGIVVHLTMYGENHIDTVKTLRNYDEDLLLVVGGPKVPTYVYSYSDFNTSIGWQPHSEVAAAAVFLYELQGADVLYREYTNADISIVGEGFKAQRSDRFVGQ